MGSRYTGRSSARIDLILPNGQPISSRAISKIRNDECGQRYAAEQLAAAGARTRDRKSVVWGKSVSVRVDLGGRRLIKKKTQYTIDDYGIVISYIENYDGSVIVL